MSLVRFCAWWVDALAESFEYGITNSRIEHGGYSRKKNMQNKQTVLDDIDQIQLGEQEMLALITSHLGESVKLVQKLVDLYGLLGELLGKVPNSLDGQQLAALLHCLQASRYQMLIGNLACLRGHPIDQSGYRRKAIEFCAFAIKMLRSPEHAQIWMNAISNRAYDKYESAFSIMATIAEAEDIMGPKLKKAYNELSKQVHALCIFSGSACRYRKSSTSVSFFSIFSRGPKKASYLYVSLGTRSRLFDSEGIRLDYSAKNREL